ncbi:MAG: FecR family protein [Candidatus Acidiferrales bacterium]
MTIEKVKMIAANKILGIAAAFFFALAALCGTAYAQDQTNPPVQDNQQVQQNAPDQNQPGNIADQGTAQAQPAVGRISMIQGDVSIQRGDSGDWIAATVNTPIEAGDRVSTGSGARAEVQLDYANVVRLDENSTIKITDLTSSHIQLQVGQGLVSYDVFENSQADAEVDTPNAALHPLHQGEYRVEVNSDSESQVTVRDGQAEVAEPQGSTRIEAGQLITIQGADNPQYKVVDAPSADDFDNWNVDRDHQIESAKSWQHTDRYYTGTQDLDAYGHWENVPDYGQVWVPDQDSNWAPYRDGSWQWEPYYGWTWVSYEPWGWAPYHYGRWFTYGGNWAWWPGPVGVYGGWGYDPIWSPAYVSFFGWGAGFGFGFGFGNVGWLPCGPGDFFRPWWGFGVNRVGFVGFHDHGFFGRGVGDRDYGRRFDPLFRGRNGFSNINRFDNDARIRSGFSSMSSDQFGKGRVSMNQHGIGTAQFHQASMMTGRLPAVPSRQSLGRVQDHVSPSIARTASANNQHFFSQSRSSSTQRSFNDQVAQTQRMISNSRTQTGGANNSRFSAPARQQSLGENGSGASRSFSNNGARQDSVSRSGGSSGSQPDAWHRFTPPSNANRQPSTNSRGAQGQTRNQQAPSQSRSNNNNGWHQFNGPAQQSRPASRPSGQPGRPGYGNFSRSSNGSSAYRPRLDMSQPIARRPSGYGSYGGGSYGRSNGGSYGRPSGNYRAPSAPRSYSRPSGGSSRGGGGGSRASAPRGGGSHGGSHGGGHPR